MMIKNEAKLQSVTINGVMISTTTGVVLRDSKAESALITLNAEYEKSEFIQRASKIATILVEEYENPTYTPNIEYLCSCLVDRNMSSLMNWLLGLALSVIRPQVDSQHILHSNSVGLLNLLEEIVNDHY